MPIQQDEPASPRISNREDAEAAMRDLIERFNIDVTKFQNDSSGLSHRCPCEYDLLIF